MFVSRGGTSYPSSTVYVLGWRKKTLNDSDHSRFGYAVPNRILRFYTKYCITTFTPDSGENSHIFHGNSLCKSDKNCYMLDIEQIGSPIP